MNYCITCNIEIESLDSWLHWAWGHSISDSNTEKLREQAEPNGE
jgi:hypothetical protein